jgi:hypothetical protein
MASRALSVSASHSASARTATYLSASAALLPLRSTLRFPESNALPRAMVSQLSSAHAETLPSTPPS